MRQIPSTGGLDPSVRKHIEAIKENLEELRGIRGDKIEQLASTATNAEIISKINEVITKIQG